MPDDRLRKLIEAEISGVRFCKFGRTQRADVTPRVASVDEAGGKSDKAPRPSGIGQLQRIGTSARVAAAGEVRVGPSGMVNLPVVIVTPPSPTEASDAGTLPAANAGGETATPAVPDDNSARVAAAGEVRDRPSGMVDLPVVIVTPPSPTETSDAGTLSAANAGGETAAPAVPDDNFVYGEDIDEGSDFGPLPAANPDAEAVAPAAHDETVEEEGGTVAALDPDSPASPDGEQIPAAGPRITPSQAARNAIPGIKDSIRSDPRSARIQLPENLSVEQWKQKGAYAKLVLNKTGVSNVLRDVGNVFKDTPMADDVVDELESVARPENTSQGGREQLDAKYERLIGSIRTAKQSVESTLKGRAKLLPSEYRTKIEAMISDLSSFESKVESRRALLADVNSAHVIDSAREKLDIPRLLGQEEQLLPARIEKIQNLLAACITLRGVLHAFGDNNPYRGLSNIQSFLEKVEFHHPEMANIARTREFSRELMGTYLWQASIAPQAENLRQMVAARDPGFEQKRRQIQEAAQADLERLRSEIEGQYGLASGSRPTKMMKDLESQIKIVDYNQATMLESMEEDIQIAEISEIKNIVDNATTELIAYNRNALRLFASVRQQMDAAKYLAPRS